jgi:RNA polymerase sigma-70 factor (ECF subfamily)
MSAPSDRDLIERARRGEADAFGELVTRYQTSVFNVCYRILYERGEAEDLAQETFIRAHQRLETFDLERPFGPWVRRVAANLCLNHLSARPATAAVLDEERDPDPGLRPDSAYEAQERGEQIRAALAALPPHYRAVVELRHYQDMSYDEIAAALRLPLSDVKSHLFRARKLLAERLKHASI